MREFFIVLVKSIFVSVVIIPATLIGLEIGGYIYGEKMEPWLNKKLKKETSE